MVYQQVQGRPDLIPHLGQVGGYLSRQELGQIIQRRRQPDDVLQDEEGLQGLDRVDGAVPRRLAYLVDGAAVVARDFGLDLVVDLVQAHQPAQLVIGKAGQGRLEHSLGDAQHTSLSASELHGAPTLGPQVGEGILHQIEVVG